jgi:hypothetical protein
VECIIQVLRTGYSANSTAWSAKTGTSSTILSPFSATPELIGHSGSTSAFLFYSDMDRLYLGGTLNQLQNQGRPFRLMLKVLQILGKKVS